MDAVNAAALSSGEILTGLLLVAIPIIAIGTLIWRLADRQRGLQASVEAAADKAAASAKGVERIEASVTAMRDELHRDYVRQDSLKETEARISKRMDDVEHTVRNTATTIISALSGVEPPPRRRRPQP